MEKVRIGMADSTFFVCREDARGSQKKKIYPARKSASQLPQKKSDWS